jgi:hypothetical protein
MYAMVEERSVPRISRFPRPCPDDFEATFTAKGRIACQEHYGVGRQTVNRWLDECGKSRLLNARLAFFREQQAIVFNRPRPQDFEIAYVKLGRNGCMRRYHCGHRAINRWLDECGRERLQAMRDRETGARLTRGDVGRLLSQAYPVRT